MTRLVQFANNAVSLLAAGITSSATTLSVTAGEGAKFPALTGSKYFMATLVKLDGSTEIVKVTARSTDTFTIVRAAEPVGGSSTAYAFSTGDRIELRMTSGALGGELDRLDSAAIISAINKSVDYTVVAADVTSLIRVDTSTGVRTITLPSIAALTDDFDIVIDKVTGDANAVTIARSSTDTINGGTVYNLTAQYQSAWVVADRSTNTWTVIQSSTSGIGVNAIVDEGTGSGASTITLSVDPGSINNVDVVIGGVPQLKSTMSLSGTTLTVGGAIASGVKWMAKYCVPLSIGTPANGTVTPAKMSTGAPTWNASGAMALAGVTPSAWASGEALDLTGNGALYGYSAGGTSSMMMSHNAYFDGTNWKSKTSGHSTLLQVNGNSFAVNTSAASAAGAGSTVDFTTYILSVTKGNSLALQGAASAAGTGISFPATQNPSSDANTLDDYEEGTWTPSLGGTTTYSTRVGRYTKIGNKVFIECVLIVNAINSPTYTGDIIGLPFTSNATEPLGTISVGYWASTGASYVYVGATIGQNGTAINLRGAVAAATILGALNFFTNGSAIYLSGQYTV